MIEKGKALEMAKANLNEIMMKNKPKSLMEQLLNSSEQELQQNGVIDLDLSLIHISEPTRPEPI
eukprot:753415-Pyramimonas_sp.AAC.1